MLSLQDLLDFCDLDEGHRPFAAAPEVSPDSVATLLSTPEGLVRLHGMMLDNMRHALETGQKDHLMNIARSFLDFHESYTLPFLARATPA
ncbi:MAG: hypothetical protein ACM3SV_00960 [Betaproteobacteria bacterium]